MLPAANDESTILVKRTLPFPAEQVFDAWLTEDIARLFLFSAPHGDVEETLIDPRVGGYFSFIDRRGDHSVLHTGEYVVIDRPSRLFFTFRIPAFHKDSILVRIYFTAAGQETHVVLDAGHVPPEARERAIHGWGSMLDLLGHAIKAMQP